MTAYNFQKRFVAAIESGEKTHTIRRNGKRRHARPGEPVQLYTGMRTKGCRKIIDPDPVCLAVRPIEIEIYKKAIRRVHVHSPTDPVGLIGSDQIDEFAKEDGFESAADMHAFWLDFHGVGVFSGSMIEWGLVDDRDLQEPKKA